jgi:DHA2 family multidrug resistance protein-like MFS transporter
MLNVTADEAPAKAGPRAWVGLGVLALASLAVSFDVFVLLLALPHLSASLDASSTEQLWILDIYGFMVGGFLVTMGSLGDRIGRRKLLLAGAAGFTVASLLSAYSTSPEMLIAARALLGVAGATLTPSTLSLISNMFRDAKQRALAIGIWAGCFTIGAIVGPIMGGVLLESFWWGSVFLLGVPAMILLLILGPMLLPEYRDRSAGRIDLASVGLSLGAVLPAIYGVDQLAIYGWNLRYAAALVVGIIMGALFVRRQRALRDPLLDLRLFRHRDFRIAMVSMLCYTMLTGTTLVFMTQFFQSVGGLSPLRAALALVPGLAVGTASVTVSPILARRLRPAYLIAGGQVIVAAGLCVIALASPATGVAPLVIGFAVWCLGGGPLLALGTNVVVGSAPPERAGSAASMSQITGEVGYALGIAIVGTAGAAVYRHALRVPAGVPAGAAGTARQNVAGAVSAARHLPATLGPGLVRSAYSAFDSGLHTVAISGAVILAGVAVVVAVRLRGMPVLGAAPAAPPEPVTEAELAESSAGPGR